MEPGDHFPTIQNRRTLSVMNGTSATYLSVKKSFVLNFMKVGVSAIVLAAFFMAGIAAITTPAFALSAACATLNSNSGTTNYSVNFPASDFAAGETITVSFTDNGTDPKTVPEINSGQIRLNNHDSSTVFYRYSTYSGSAGPHSGSHNTLSTDGLGMVINAKGHLSGVTIFCSAAVAEPTINAIMPSNGITTGGTSVTITGTNLTGATGVSIGGVAATNVTVLSSTKITATTPAHVAGPVNVAVTTPGGTVVMVNSFTYVAANPPVASAVSKSVFVDSSDNMIALDVTGGPATSVAVATQASHGTATASGLSITYTPAAGYSGPDSFTYTASNIDGTSAEATVSITVAAAPPTLTGITPNTGTTAGGTAVTITGTHLSGTTRVSVGGVAATDVTVVSSTTITATTPPHAAGLSNVAVSTPGGDDILVNSFTYIAEPIAISPTSGALAEATKGAAYNQPLSLSGGTAPFLFRTSGSVPAGLTVNPATGTISGTPTATGTYEFSVTVVDANNHIGSASYVLTVVPSQSSFVFTPSAGALKDAMAGEEYSQLVSVTGGNGALLYSLVAGALPDGVTLNLSTGELTGPLDADAEAKSYAITIQVRDGSGATGMASYTLEVKARAVTVVDKVVTVEAGSSPADVYLNRGATGGPFVQADLTFVEPPNAGTTAIIQGQLAQSGPVTKPLGWYLQFTPNPAYKGQVRVGFRLTSALGISNTGTVTYNIAYDTEQVVSDTDRLVRSFVQSRQSMISSLIHVPGLLERRRMAEATDPVTARLTPSENGMTAQFSTSLVQIESARNSADGIVGGYSAALNIWIDGSVLAHNDEDINGGKWGNFAMINMGADYLLSEKALLGLSFHYDHMTNPTDEDAELKGNGWLAGPYASFEFGKGVFWNGSLLYGGSSNDIDTLFWDGSFETKRWMADTSIEGQWDLGNATTLTPKLRAVYFTENVESYTIGNAAGDTIAIDGFDAKQFRVSLGSEIARSFTLESGATLKSSFAATGGFAALDGSGAFGTAKAGLSLQTEDQWTLDASLLFNIEGEGQRSVGARVAAGRQF
ncbi:autotransporter domain-containing protein [Agrobacterium tumefaciens]|uniref:IPT/TIG domain-containing protein n=1 Tax=Agrobacterium tumefaciens TaxID=358 RepID=UPI0015722B43|nr:autotransporter domain-containing protein [Agrobacterium tumefaciens]